MLWNALSRRMPALATTMSTRPNSSMAWATMAWPPSGVATDVLSATAMPPAARISSATALAGSSLVPSPFTDPPSSFTTTWAPAGAEQQRVGPPEAATGAGHDGHPFVESQLVHHCPLPRTARGYRRANPYHGRTTAT